jgi:hypothetical protein
MLLVLVGAAAVRPARAETPPPVVTREARTEVAVTVYNDDLALVKDTREFPLAAGESTLRFEDVAARIDPRTVAIRSLTAPDELAVVEQNYVFDLISPEKLMEKYVGRAVELVEADERLRLRTTPAVLLSTNGGPVYRIGDRIAIDHPGRVILPELPRELYARPTLLWQLANAGPARQRVEVSYLTGGLSWAADYVAVVDREDARADLTAWVTLTNQSGARYEEATLKLVAGRPHRVDATVATAAETKGMVHAARAPAFAEEAFFEYHLYTLDRRTTLADNETKQLRLLAAAGVPLGKQFRVVGQPHWYRSPTGELEHPVPVRVFLELRNEEASRLGMPLPAGIVRLYKQDRSGAEHFIGEDAIRHTPRGETVTLQAGEAFDVVASRRQTDYRKISVRPWQAEAAFALRVRNRKQEAITVTVREPIGGEWIVVESSHEPVRVDAGTLGFTVPVAADGTAEVSYRVRVAF